MCATGDLLMNLLSHFVQDLFKASLQVTETDCPGNKLFLLYCKVMHNITFLYGVPPAPSNDFKIVEIVLDQKLLKNGLIGANYVLLFHTSHSGGKITHPGDKNAKSKEKDFTCEPPC